VVAAMVRGLRLRAQPASVDSVPTDANKEDHVSMGPAAALKARDSVALLETVAALELLTAAQALEFLKPLKPGRGVAVAYELVRRHVAPLNRDRVLAGDIAALERQVREGVFSTIWSLWP
jgi:histidine ammonia-lyase